MNHEREPLDIERYEFAEPPRYVFSLSRRGFVQSVGAGLLISSFVDWTALGQQRGRDNEGPSAVGGRFHIGKDGRITAFTGKVEVGQGARTQLTQAAAEELRVPVSSVTLVMADTSLVPDDGGTYGSLTTPRTVPVMRQAAAAARGLLIELACSHWKVEPNGAELRDGKIVHSSGKAVTLAELVAAAQDFDENLRRRSTDDVTLTPPDAWTVLGRTSPPVNAGDLVTGRHQFTSDIRRPGMVYGKVLRPPVYRAELNDVDIKAAEAVEGVTVVRDGAFVGVVAPNNHTAQRAINALAAAATWNTQPHPSSEELYDYLKANQREGTGRQRSREEATGDVDGALAAAKQTARAEYRIPYIQHAPMEPRAAVAELGSDGVLTVWTGTQRPFDVRDEVAEALSMPPERVRLIVPDTGGGFGGKHSGDAAVEAARLALAVKHPVAVQWTREEEFVWAYCRPAGLIEAAAAIGADGKITAWDFTNYNSGGSGLACPYAFPNVRTRFRNTESPLRQGSYRALAATANNFARECFIDELAAMTNTDPLAFRMAYLDEPRMKNALEAAASRFDFTNKRKNAAPNTGYGIACGTEKGSVVATCAEVTVRPADKRWELGKVCVAFECGAIHNPQNLQAQVEGCVLMGLGAVVREAMEFKDGKVATTNFKTYKVPRFEDVPELDIVLVNRPDLASAGAGETPIIAIAPAIANALRQAAGQPFNTLPLRFA